MPMTDSVVKRESVYEEFEWKIQNFTFTKGNYWTPEFKFRNETWEFWVYPKFSDEYIGLRLCRHSSDSLMNVKFSVALKTSDGQKSFERGWTDIFDEGKHDCCYRWMKRSEFERRESEFLSSGCLTVLITLKRVDYVEPASRLHFFRSKYIPRNKNNYDPISHESLNMSTTRDEVPNENVSHEFEWKIENFSLNKVSHWSPEFLLKSETWVFRMIPNLSGEYIGLRIGRITLDSPLLVEFSVALKTSDGQKRFERGWTDIFDEWKYSCEYRWMRRCEFERRQTEFLSSGCLSIIITLKIVDAVEPANASGADVCPCCRECLHDDKIAVHKKCLDKSKCPKCDQAVSSQNWFSHKCQVATVKGENGAGFQPKKKILQDLKEMFSSQENCDVVLRVKGKEFKAHKNILMARSHVFASTFRNDMKEKESGVVNIEDIDPSSFSEFLRFLYCEELETLSEENAHSLFTAADKYDIADLRTMCLNFMKDNLSVDTFCETLVLALLHTETGLIKACTDFFVQNAEEIIVSVKWQLFAVENPTQSNELFLKYVKSMKHSNK